MIRVFLLGRMSDPDTAVFEQDKSTALEMGRRLAEMGYNPFIAQACSPSRDNMADLSARERFALELDWLENCHAILLLPGWDESTSAVAAYEHAECIGIPSFISMDDLRYRFPPTRRLYKHELHEIILDPQIICD